MLVRCVLDSSTDRESVSASDLDAPQGRRRQARPVSRPVDAGHSSSDDLDGTSIATYNTVGSLIPKAPSLTRICRRPSRLSKVALPEADADAELSQPAAMGNAAEALQLVSDIPGHHKVHSHSPDLSLLSECPTSDGAPAKDSNFSPEPPPRKPASDYLVPGWSQDQYGAAAELRRIRTAGNEPHAMPPVHADEETLGNLCKAIQNDPSVLPGHEVLSRANASEAAQLSAAPALNEPPANALLPAAPAGAMPEPAVRETCGSPAPLSQLHELQSLPSRAEGSTSMAHAPFAAAALAKGPSEASNKACRDSDALSGLDSVGQQAGSAAAASPDACDPRHEAAISIPGPFDAGSPPPLSNSATDQAVPELCNSESDALLCPSLSHHGAGSPLEHSAVVSQPESSAAGTLPADVQPSSPHLALDDPAADTGDQPAQQCPAASQPRCSASQSVRPAVDGPREAANAEHATTAVACAAEAGADILPRLTRSAAANLAPNAAGATHVQGQGMPPQQPSAACAFESAGRNDDQPAEDEVCRAASGALLQQGSAAAQAPAEAGKRQTRAASGQLDGMQPLQSWLARGWQFRGGMAHEDSDSQSGANDAQVQIIPSYCIEHDAVEQI